MHNTTFGKQKHGLISLVAAATMLVTALSSPAAIASGGTGGGGGGSTGAGGGGGTGGGGGKNSVLISTSQVCDNWGVYYNGVMPQGDVTFLYSPDGTSRTFSMQVFDINVPDGTVMQIETQEIWPSATGIPWRGTYYPVMIRQGKGNVSFSTSAGDAVTFLPPTVGQTNVYLWTPDLQRPLMGAQLGHLN